MNRLSRMVRVGKRRRLNALKEDENPSRGSDNVVFKKKIQKPKSLWDVIFDWIKYKDGWVWLIIIIVLVGGGSYVLFGTGFSNISEVKIEGTNHISQEELDSLINDYRNSKKLLIFPKNNYFFFDVADAQAAVTENINNKFVLESITIKKKFPNKLSVQITERIPGLIWQSQEKKYLLDINGITSEEQSEIAEEDKYPHIIDKNDKPVEPGKQVISKELIDFILLLNQTFNNKTGLELNSFIIPQIQCQEKIYVAEKILQKEIEQEDDEDTKNKKKKILEQYNAGEITVEESLAMLDDVKNNNKNKNKEGESPDEPKDESGDGADEYIQWSEQYEPTECDLVKINSEVYILTKDGFEVYFDSKLDLDSQLDNLKTILMDSIEDKSGISYIDLRFPDRIYYQ
ncbi:MAG: FtsQ-type POTRA domain-containing protein [Patescibacteria group bacterium]|nr:FtsQ-type POTRA domain-containing protein [Patescibacteria group bacterium]